MKLLSHKSPLDDAWAEPGQVLFGTWSDRVRPFEPRDGPRISMDNTDNTSHNIAVLQYAAALYTMCMFFVYFLSSAAGRYKLHKPDPVRKTVALGCHNLATKTLQDQETSNCFHFKRPFPPPNTFHAMCVTFLEKAIKKRSLLVTIKQTSEDQESNHWRVWRENEMKWVCATPQLVAFWSKSYLPFLNLVHCCTLITTLIPCSLPLMPLRHCSASVRSRGEAAGWSGFKLGRRCHTRNRCHTSRCEEWVRYGPMVQSDQAHQRIGRNVNGTRSTWSIAYMVRFGKSSWCFKEEFLSHRACTDWCNANHATIRRAWPKNGVGVFEWKPRQLRHLLVLMQNMLYIEYTHIPIAFVTYAWTKTWFMRWFLCVFDFNFNIGRPITAET